MIGEKTDLVEEFWQSCQAEFGIARNDYHVSTFADPRFASYQGELIELAIEEKKQATAHLALDFERNGVKRREVGDYWVIVTPECRPRCLLRITDVVVWPFNAVPESFGVREGEGDGSFAYWEKVHREYFKLQCDHWGVEWRDDLATVCEGFKLIAVACVKTPK